MEIAGIALIIVVLFVVCVIIRNRKAEAERKERLKHVFDHYEGSTPSRTKVKGMEDMTPEEAYQKGKQLSGYKENIRFSTLKNKSALPYIEYAAENGHAEAQHLLSECYYGGNLGLEPDDKKCLYWEEKAAKQGHAVAQEQCGSMYEQGIGCVVNLEKALYWYECCLKTMEADPEEYIESGKYDDVLKYTTIKEKAGRLQYQVKRPLSNPTSKPAAPKTAAKPEPKPAPIKAERKIDLPKVVTTESAPAGPKSPYMSVVRVFKGGLGESMIVADMMKGEISVKDKFRNDRTGKVYKADAFRFINSIQNFDENANDPDSYVDCVNAETAGHRMFVFFIWDSCDIESGDWLAKCE